MAEGPHRGRRWAAFAAVLGVLGAALLVVSVAQAGDDGNSSYDASAPAATATASPPGTPVAGGAGGDEAASGDGGSPGAATAPAGVPEGSATGDDAIVEPPGVEESLTPSPPTAVRIPAIDVDSPLIGLGLDDDGAMEVPQGPDPAGWYTGGPTPGALGPSVIAGHVTWNGKDGVFRRLESLNRGDRVEVDRSDGRTAIFEVTRVEEYDKTRFPTDEVYGIADSAVLRLITCGGVFDGDRYSSNVVAYAKLVGAREGT